MNCQIRKRILESESDAVNEIFVHRQKHSVDVKPDVPEEKNQYETGTFF
jgi:hypothetical protein